LLRDFARRKNQSTSDGGLEGKFRATFGLTEPISGSDATHMETRAVRHKKDGRMLADHGEKM